MRVIMYSTGCPKCSVLKKKLNERGIQFEEVTDVNEMMSLGIEAVPVLSIDGTLMDFSSANAWLNYAAVADDDGGCESCRLS